MDGTEREEGQHEEQQTPHEPADLRSTSSQDEHERRHTHKKRHDQLDESARIGPRQQDVEQLLHASSSRRVGFASPRPSMRHM